MDYLSGRPWATFALSRGGKIKGNCAYCRAVVGEDLFTLDDCYGVWRGECPECGAINLLDESKGRGYTKFQMWLVLPTDHECKENDWKDCLFTRPCGCLAHTGESGAERKEKDDGETDSGR